MIHIATVHRGPRWVDVQLEHLRRHLAEPFAVWASVEDVPEDATAKFDRAIEMRGAHAGKLNLLWTQLDEVVEDDDVVVFCDSDAFPIADLTAPLRSWLAGHPLVAIQRVEDGGDPQPHPSFCAAAAGTWRAVGCDWSDGYPWPGPAGGLTSDVGSNLLYRLERAGVDWLPLRRENTHDLHPVWFGVYGGVIYHHGAGSRRYPLSRPETAGLRYHRSRRQPLRFVLDVPVALRRRHRIWRNRRLSTAVFRRILADPGFWRAFVDAAE